MVDKRFKTFLDIQTYFTEFICHLDLFLGRHWQRET